MLGELLGLLASVALAAVVLLSVPRRASYAWAIGLLILAFLGNLTPVIEGVVSYYNPPMLYLDTKQNQLEFHQGKGGEVFGVRVNRPPPAYRTTRNELPWTLPLGNMLLLAVIFVFVRRAATETSSTVAVSEKVGQETGSGSSFEIKTIAEQSAGPDRGRLPGSTRREGETGGAGG